MLTFTVVLQHNLGINSLIFIHHILGKLNFLRLTRRALRSHPRLENFGDPRVTPHSYHHCEWIPSLGACDQPEIALDICLCFHHYSDCRAWWLSCRFSALHPEGRRFESHSMAATKGPWAFPSLRVACSSALACYLRLSITVVVWSASE